MNSSIHAGNTQNFPNSNQYNQNQNNNSSSLQNITSIQDIPQSQSQHFGNSLNNSINNNSRNAPYNNSRNNNNTTTTNNNNNNSYYWDDPDKVPAKIFGGISTKLSNVSEELKRNMHSFSIGVERGTLNKDYNPGTPTGKFDLYVSLRIGNHNFKTPASIDCGKQPSWGREAVYNFYAKEWKGRPSIIKVELWNFATEVGDVLLGTGSLDIMEPYENRRGQAKVIIWQNDNQTHEKSQIGYIEVDVKFTAAFEPAPRTNWVQHDPPSMKNLVSGKRNYEFSDPVIIEGYTITKKDIEERRTTFEEKMQRFQSKFIH